MLHGYRFCLNGVYSVVSSGLTAVTVPQTPAIKVNCSKVPIYDMPMDVTRPMRTQPFKRFNCHLKVHLKQKSVILNQLDLNLDHTVEHEI